MASDKIRESKPYTMGFLREQGNGKKAAAAYGIVPPTQHCPEFLKYCLME